MVDKNTVIITALLVLGLLEGWALWLGHNGTILAAVVGILGIVVGVPAGFKVKERMINTSSE